VGEQAVAARADFKDLVLSAKETMTSKESPNYKLPILYPFLGDDPEDEFQKLTVKTNENGYACVGFYPGNASNFSYKLRASLGGDTEDWIIKTRKRSEMDPRYAVGGYGYLPSTAIVGQQLEIGAMFKQYNYDPTHCNVDTCIIDMLPLSDEIATWSYSLNSGPPINFRDTQLDLNGGTSINWVVGQDPLMAKGDNIEIYVETWWTEIAVAADINAVMPEDVKIKMEKVMFNSSAALPEGGTVASSFLGLSDLGVKVTIENQPSFFGRMELSEESATGGRNMLDSPKPYYYEADPNNSVIFPKEMQGKYFYSLTPFAPRGTFTLKLFDHESDMMISSTFAKIENDYMTFDCTPNPQNLNQCQGTLAWRDGSGIPFWGWAATSGGRTNYPYLPPGTYTINDINDHMLYEKNGAYCDNSVLFDPNVLPEPYQCWSAPFIETIPPNSVFDSKVGRGRQAISIHPDGHGIGTDGCIGIDPNFPTRQIRANLEIFFRDFGQMKVIVQ